MHICTTTILFKEHPLSWDYDEEADMATFLFTLAGTNENYEKSTLVAYLMELDLKGIVLSAELTKEGHATPKIVIPNASNFFRSHPMMPIIEYQEKPKIPSINFSKVQQEQEIPGQGKSTPLPPTRPSRSRTLPGVTEMPPQVIPRHSSAPEKEAPKSVKRGLQIDNIIPQTEKTSPIWGRTLCYKDYFIEAIEKELACRSQFIESACTVMTKEQQLPKNIDLYKVKKNQIELICQLFDNILAPIYDQLYPHNDPGEEVIKYFRTVIEGVMVNDPLNLGPTDFESLYESKRLNRFHGDREMIDFAITEERVARANIMMLRPLLFFVRDDIKSAHLTSCKEVIQLLDQIKLKIKEKNLIDSVELRLYKLAKVTAQSGQIEEKHEKIKTKIQQRDKNKERQIGQSSYSCYRLISDFLDTQLPKTKEKEQLLDSISQESVEMIIRTIDETITPVIGDKILPKIREDDFYFGQNWYDQLSSNLGKDLGKVFSSMDLSKKGMKDQEKIVSIIHDYIKGFMMLSLEQAKQPKELALTSSSDKGNILSPRAPPPSSPRMTLSGIAQRPASQEFQ